MTTPSLYTEIPFTQATLDRYHQRRSIVRALRFYLPEFRGLLLDVGCGLMPYRPIVLAPPGRVTRYLGLDLHVGVAATYDAVKPDIAWDGRVIPLADESVDTAMATEVFEHCPDPLAVMQEVQRVLRPDGVLFFTVPFLWPLHDVPHDEYRYTPFSLRRLLTAAGFRDVRLEAMGGWNASLAQMLGLWIRRSPMSRIKRKLASIALKPVIRRLIRTDRVPTEFGPHTMLTGLSGIARK